ncbi:MAG: hypothetical protein ACYC6N_19550 [Pirellulaceae bacterium]
MTQFATQKDAWPIAVLRITPLLFGLLLSGCQARHEEGPPIRPEDAAKIKSGMTLAEIEAILGPARAASREESERLNEVFSKVPERMRRAESPQGTDRGWGNSQAWLAARITADGHAWLVASHFGGTRPPQPPDAPKVYVRDFSKGGRE